MKWYKYTESRFAEMFAKEGKVRLNSLDYYRDVELHGRAIGDAHENTRSIESYAHNLTARQLNPFQRSLVSIDERHCDMDTIRFVNSNFVHRHVGRPTYAICLSDVFSLSIPQQINVDNAEANSPAYDAYVEISDHVSFVKLLAQEAWRQAGLRYYGHGNCFYKKRRVDWRHWNPMVEQCPAFIKPPEYSWQKEVRVLFSMEDSKVDGPVDLEIFELSHISGAHALPVSHGSGRAEELGVRVDGR